MYSEVDSLPFGIPTWPGASRESIVDSETGISEEGLVKIELDLSHEQAERLRAEAARHGAAPDRLLEALVGYLLELPAVDLGIFARHALRNAGEYSTGAPLSDLVSEPPSPAYGSSALAHRVTEERERVVVSFGGARAAALVPLEDLEILERIEDEIDLAAAREALAEVEAEGAVPWEQVKSELGL